tara:strand:+ start:1294 stop:1770 length:477 start_codon:yes stop_codon:yes gene_type:complete
MTWSSNGSVADRLRALKFRDSITPQILLKQEEDPMGMMNAGLQNVQPPTAEAAGGIPGMGKPPKSDVGIGLDSLLEPFSMMDQNIAQVKLLIDQQGVAGVLPQPLEDLENDLLDLEQILTKIKQGIRRMGAQHASLGQHDASQSVGPAANQMMMGGGM